MINEKEDYLFVIAFDNRNRKETKISRDCFQ